jgi:hypothetical protein
LGTGDEWQELQRDVKVERAAAPVLDVFMRQHDRVRQLSALEGSVQLQIGFPGSRVIRTYVRTGVKRAGDVHVEK